MSAPDQLERTRQALRRLIDAGTQREVARGNTLARIESWCQQRASALGDAPLPSVRHESSERVSYGFSTDDKVIDAWLNFTLGSSGVLRLDHMIRLPTAARIATAILGTITDNDLTQAAVNEVIDTFLRDVEKAASATPASDQPTAGKPRPPRRR